MMIEIKLLIQSNELPKLLPKLQELADLQTSQADRPTSMAPGAMPLASSIPTAVQLAPLPSAPAPLPVTFPTAAVPMPQPLPLAVAPAPAIPLAVPEYTDDMIGRAGAAFVDLAPTNVDLLLSVMAEFGISAVSQLQDRGQRNAFVQRLRQIGVKI